MGRYANSLEPGCRRAFRMQLSSTQPWRTRPAFRLRCLVRSLYTRETAVSCGSTLIATTITTIPGVLVNWCFPGSQPWATTTMGSTGSSIRMERWKCRFYSPGSWKPRASTWLPTSHHPGRETAYGHLVDRNLLAVHHQHFFNFRLDMDVDGTKNSVAEMNTEAEGRESRQSI